MSGQKHDDDRCKNSVGVSGARRREARVWLSGWSDPAGIRRAAAQFDPSHPGAARAGCHAHGRWLRARHRRRGRRGGHFRPRRHQHGHRHRHGDARLLAYRVHHRASRQQTAGLGRLSGNRHHRRDAADHQAQLSGDPRRRDRPHGARSLLRGEVRAARTGADRHHQGRAAKLLRVRLGSGRAQDARVSSRSFAGERRVHQGPGADPRIEAAADPRRAWHRCFRRGDTKCKPSRKRPPSRWP